MVGAGSRPLKVLAFLPGGVAGVFAQAAGATAQVEDADPANAGMGGADVLLVSPSGGLRDRPRPAGWPLDVRWVHLISAGVDSYPDWLFEGVRVTNSPGVSAIPLAEFALAAILAHARGIPGAAVSGPEGWKPSRSRRVQNTTLGIVGFGAIGSALAVRALALGMKVRVLRRSAAPLPQGVERAADLAELAAASDHLVLAAPGGAETRGMVNASVLARARPGLHLINVGRGSLVDQDALLQALADGRLSRATLDVAEPEPLPAGHPFYTHPDIFLTPHTASFDDHVLPDLARMFGENLERFVSGEPLLWEVARTQSQSAITAS